jgi:hypothetical protein
MINRAFVWTVLLLTAAPRLVHGQQPPGTSKPAMVPLQVEIVMSRYQGDKKISSIPYTLNVNANGTPTQLNMGTQVPVVSTVLTPSPQAGATTQPLQSYNYRNVGTNIDLRASSSAEGSYELQLTVEDSSVYTPEGQPQGSATLSGLPAFRNFKSTNSLLLRDGQSRQYTVATDRVSLEVTKLDVTLKVLR